MGEWKEFKITDLAEILNQKRIPLSSMQRASRKGKFPYYGASGIIDYINDYIFQGEHVLVSEDGENLKSRNTPIAFKANGYFWVNNHAHILKGYKDYHNTLIIYYLENLELNPYLTGAVQPKLNKAALESIPFYLPKNENEQRAIASILSSLDDKIDLLHRQNETLEKIAEALFRQWFVEEAKEEWEMGKVSDLFILQRGFDLPIQNRIEGTYPIYSSSGVSGFHKDYKINGPGVTTGRSGVLGNVFYIHENFWPLNTSLYIKEFILSNPLHAFFTLKNIDLNNFNAGSAVPTLNRNHLHDYSITIPPINLISEFEEICLPYFHKIKSNQTQINTLTSLRDTLLPKLMSGEVRVSGMN